MKSSKRRTTLTLPADALRDAEKIARARHLNLSAVVAEAMVNGLKMQASASRSNEVLEGYRRAFQGFSEDEMAILDGVILEPVKAKA